ncbi:hypothetical protein JTB14_013090 [Gonioctena quinquepunctata]|nr:hypothetical protein JTB14_013090 [Gonioctena quinquepunctata]
MLQEDEKEIPNEDLFNLIKTAISSNNEIKKQNDEIVEEKGQILEDILLMNEMKQKKYNLIVYGIKKEEDEVWDIENFPDIINITCEVGCKYHDLREWYRIGESKQNTERPRPIVVELIYYREQLS